MKKRIEMIYPDFSNLKYNGDYAIANFLNTYGKKNAIRKEEEYSTQFKDTLGISDCRVFHYKLIADGYLAPSSTQDYLETETHEKLIEIANELGYPNSGTQEQLLARLSLNVSTDVLQKVMPLSDTFSLSSLGKQFQEKNQDLIRFYENGDVYHITYDEYAKQKELHPEDTYTKLLWDAINTRFGEYIDENNYEAAQVEYCNMYALFKSEEKNTEALEALLTYFNMAINAFAQTMNCIAEFKKTDETAGPFLEHCHLPQVKISPERIDQIHELKDAFDPNSLKRIDQNDSNFYVNSADFNKMVNDIFEGAFQLEETEEQINSTIKSKLDHILRNEKGYIN